VGALWQPSFISARPGVAAAAGIDVRLAAAAAPETVTNRRRFISVSLLPIRNYYTSSNAPQECVFLSVSICIHLRAKSFVAYLTK
jgi:hypothetical protein